MRLARYLKDGVGSGVVQVYRLSPMGSWATLLRLKRPLALVTSSTSIFDSSLDRGVKGPIGVLAFRSLPLPTSCCRGLWNRSSSDFSWSRLAVISCTLWVCSNSAFNILFNYSFVPVKRGLVFVQSSLVPVPSGWIPHRNGLKSFFLGLLYFSSQVIDVRVCHFRLLELTRFCCSNEPRSLWLTWLGEETRQHHIP